jgi:hypothetical protein
VTGGYRVIALHQVQVQLAALQLADKNAPVVEYGQFGRQPACPREPGPARFAIIPPGDD